MDRDGKNVILLESQLLSTGLYIVPNFWIAYFIRRRFCSQTETLRILSIDQVDINMFANTCVRALLITLCLYCWNIQPVQGKY